MKSSARTMQNLMMQRRHFELIAAIIAGLKIRHGAKLRWEDVVIAFKDGLRSTNPGFDPQKFYEACNDTEV